MNGKKRTGIVAILLLLFAGPAAAYYAFREDPQIAKVKYLGEKLREEGVTREERGKIWQELGETFEQMGPEKQVQMMMQSNRGNREWGPSDERIDEFFALPSKERKAKLEVKIREDEKSRLAREKRDKEREAERAKQAAANGGALAMGGTGGGGPSGAGGGGQGGPGQGGPGRGGPGRGMGNDSARAQQRRLMLDAGSPEGRAKRSEYRREEQVKRVQMGLPAERPRGGGRGPR